MKTVKKMKVLVAVLMISCLACLPAWADSEETTVLETMVVNNSGQKTKLLDTNASIHVITAKDIANSGQSSTADLISTIPGVVNQKSSSKTYFSVRGTRSTMSSGPQIYVDGRPINVGSSGYSKIDTIPLDTIEKIEVIKSPSPAKYGVNASRGVILITTKKGGDGEKALSGQVAAEYGSWNTAKANAGISGQKDRTDYSISAFAKETDGYRGSDEDIKSMDGQIGWKFDGGRIDWTTGYNKSFLKYSGGLPYWQAEADRTSSGYNTAADGSGDWVPPNETDENLFNTILKLDYDKNDWLVNSSVGYTRDHQEYSYKKYEYSASKSGNYVDDRVEDRYDFKASAGRVFRGETVTNTLIIGVDYSFSDFEQDRSYPYATSAVSAELSNDIDAEKEFIGINLNHEVAWNIFRLQSGLRYNNVSYELTDRTPETFSINYKDDIDWSISPSVNILDNANMFVTWNHSKYYVPLGYYTTDMGKNNDHTRPEDLDPESYNTVETGWKHQMSKAFNYSLILYYTEVEDKIVAYYEGNTFKGYRNGGTSIHKGVEAEVDGRPLSWLGYRVSFSTIDAEWDKGSAVACTSTGSSTKSTIDLSGKTVNMVPDYEYTLGLDFYPLKDTRYGSLTIALDLRGFGEQYEDYNNLYTMPAANFLDAKVTWAFKGFEYYVACTNILDREWDRISNSSGYPYTNSSRSLYPQDGRYIGFGVAYRF